MLRPFKVRKCKCTQPFFIFRCQEDWYNQVNSWSHKGEKLWNYQSLINQKVLNVLRIEDDVLKERCLLMWREKVWEFCKQFTFKMQLFVLAYYSSSTFFTLNFSPTLVKKVKQFRREFNKLVRSKYSVVIYFIYILLPWKTNKIFFKRLQQQTNSCITIRYFIINQ